MISQDRRNDFDVTNTVQVSSPASVRNAVHELFSETFPGASFDKLWLAFYDFERLFTGRYPGYLGCDTTYHDVQHSLDMTLALARLITGYERSVEPADRLGAGRALMAIITALFHDSGYIRHKVRDREFDNGAQFTMQHVSRSADFLRRYLPELGMAKDVGIASMIVHFTGYELDLDKIELDDPRDIICGHLIGTADLIAQMADRCYLENVATACTRNLSLAGSPLRTQNPANTWCAISRAKTCYKRRRRFISKSRATGSTKNSIACIATPKCYTTDTILISRPFGSRSSTS